MSDKKWVGLSKHNISQVICNYSKIRVSSNIQFIPLKIESPDENHYYIYGKRTYQGCNVKEYIFAPYIPENWKNIIELKCVVGDKYFIEVIDTYDDLKADLCDTLIKSIEERNLLDFIIQSAYETNVIYKSEFTYSIGDTKNDLRNELYMRSGPFVDRSIFDHNYYGECYLDAYDQFGKHVYHGFGEELRKTNNDYNKRHNILTMASFKLDGRFQYAVDFTFYYDKNDRCFNITLIERGGTNVFFEIEKIFLTYRHPKPYYHY